MHLSLSRPTISVHPSPPLLPFYKPQKLLLLQRERWSGGGVGGRVLVARCSLSQVHSYGTVDYEKKPVLKWSSLYRKISMQEDPSVGTSAALERWDVEQRRLSKWELCRVAKELRKFRRFNLALQVYEWMAAQGDRFTFSSSDIAIQLDLVAKVRGIPQAEEHFSMLPDALKDKRTYCAILNAYGQARMKEKAEATVEIMREKGYTTDPLPFNVMMTLYMNIGENEKVSMIVKEMRERNISFDIYSYNIWITSSAAMDDVQGMEQVVELMMSDSTINANWTTFTTLASMYMKLGDNEKALNCLKDVEIRMTGRDRTSFNYLIGLYASLRKKEDVYRLWKWYKSSFPVILNLGYQAMVSALTKLEDIQGAETIFEEWLSITSSRDPRICNILMGYYVREGLVVKARGLLDRLLEKGGKPKPYTWEILAEGYINQKQITEALQCMKEVASGPIKWRPKPSNIANLLTLCREQNQTEHIKVVMDLLRNMGCHENEEYRSLIDTYSETSAVEA